jgi:hypothetical protein
MIAGMAGTGARRPMADEPLLASIALAFLFWLGLQLSMLTIIIP